jgi:uncharacterized protein involved in exopolysaccharide biosynthesis
MNLSNTEQARLATAFATLDADSAADTRFSIDGLFKLITRRRRAFVISAATLLLFAVAFVALATPKYTAIAAVLMETNRAPPAASDGRQEGLVDTAVVDSQIAILNSDGIARAVIAKLRLGDDPEFNKPGLLGQLKEMIGIAGARVDPDDNEVSEAVMTRFKRGLSVTQIGRGYIAEISFTARDPQKSADIANAIADTYIQDQLGAKLSAAQRAGKWMDDWATKSRQEASEAARAVDDFRTANRNELAASNSTAAASLQGLEKTAESKKGAYETVRTRSGRLRQFVEDQAFPFTQARIISQAQPPASPSFPKTPLILLGAIVGSGLVGASAVYARELLDKRLYSADQLYDLVGIRPAVTVPWPKHRSAAANVDRNVLAFWRGDAANASFWRLKAAIDRRVAGTPPRLVTFVSARHCDSRAALAHALTEVLVKSGGRTLLIDADTVHAALTTALMQDRQAAKIRRLRDESESGLRPVAVGEGFDFLPAARRSGVADLLACFRSREMMRRLGDNYDYVLIDLPPMLECGEASAMTTVGNGCILVAHSNCSSASDIARGLELNLLDPQQVTAAAFITVTPLRAS